jgi:hypothetical protein
MDKRQTGFVRKMGTTVNIQILLNKIHSTQKNAGLFLIFIDFKSAYNTILRHKLYERLLEKNILEKDEIIFMENLHKNLYFDANG